MSFSLYLIALVLIIYILKVVSRFNKRIKTVDQIPGPKCSSVLGKILGNLEIFWKLKNVPDTTALFMILVGLVKAYSDKTNKGLFRAWIGPVENVVVLYKAKTIEPLLSSNALIDKAKEYRFFYPWIGLGLLTSGGERWRTHRKLLTPCFHFKILENFVPIINRQQRIMNKIIEEISNKNNGIVDDIRPIITNCALDTICETAMGVSVGAQTKPDSDYVICCRDILRIFFERFLRPWLWIDFIFYNFSDLATKQNKMTQTLHKFTESVINERKTEFLSQIRHNKLSIGENLETELKRRFAFLDALLIHHLNDPKSFTEKDIREEVDTFMFEGHDTTSAALMWSFLLIGLHKDIQVRIHSEMDEIFESDTERDITLDDLKRMKYLEQCLKESLRLYPPVPYIGRINNEEFQIDDYTVPKHTTCFVVFYSLHRDPEVFPRPEVFDPDRFSSELTTERNAYAYLPFSAGARNCIGQKFALLEAKALLASVLRQFVLQSLVDVSDVKMDIAAILKPKTEIKIKFTKRIK